VLGLQVFILKRIFNPIIFGTGFLKNKFFKDPIFKFIEKLLTQNNEEENTLIQNNEERTTEENDLVKSQLDTKNFKHINPSKILGTGMC
jgi:hypothetical protein